MVSTKRPLGAIPAPKDVELVIIHRRGVIRPWRRLLSGGLDWKPRVGVLREKEAEGLQNGLHPPRCRSK